MPVCGGMEELNIQKIDRRGLKEAWNWELWCLMDFVSLTGAQCRSRREKAAFWDSREED